MKSFSVKTRINAAPAAIWTILTDAARIPEWDPGMDRIEGTIGPGEKLKVFPKYSKGRAFALKVTAFEPGSHMIWTGGMPLGLFKGVRTFRLTPGADGQTEFAMEEVFSGLMAPLITKSIPDLNPHFEDFAAGLKRRAEAAT